MGFIQILGIAVALAMDAFAVAMAIGVRMQDVSRRQVFRLSWHFGLFQALMPVLGWNAGIGVRDYIARYDHWVAFGLLVLVGGRMILEAVKGLDEVNVQHRDPTRGITLIILSVATSIDALAVGFSLSMLEISIVVPALVIGIVALLLTFAGILGGSRVSRLAGFSRYAAFAGGGILILIALRILIEDGGISLF
jgi:putative Mn2+ efflux pump MntP